MNEKLPNAQSASVKVSASPFSVEANVQVTPKGLLAIAALVSTILLSTSVVVWVAKQRP